MIAHGQNANMPVKDNEAEADPGKWKKYTALVMLMVQTTAVVLTMRLSVMDRQQKQYLKTTAVVMSEVFKVAFSLVLFAFELKNATPARVAHELHRELVVEWRSFALLCVPAGLYVLQNNLIFVALANLDGAKYQVMYQLKIVVTALFAVLLLGQQLSRTRWLAIVILMLGAIGVQLPPSNKATANSDQDASLAGNQYIGAAAVLTACCTSGFAGVYFEKILKGTQSSLWVRNVQLGLISIVIGLVGVYTKDRAALQGPDRGGFFQGYRPLVWVVVLLQSLGGLVVAAVIKYADNIVKAFANCVSIVITGTISYVALDDVDLSTNFLVGAPVVIGAAYLYGTSK